MIGACVSALVETFRTGSFAAGFLPPPEPNGPDLVAGYDDVRRGRSCLADEDLGESVHTDADERSRVALSKVVGRVDTRSDRER